MGIVADDVEDPEGEHRPADVARHFAVHALQQRQDLAERSRVADVGGGAGAALDVAHDQDAGLGVDDLGRDAGGESRLAGGALVEAHDLVDGDVVADADDVALAGVLDDEIDVGGAAAQRLAGRPGRARSRDFWRGLSAMVRSWAAVFPGRDDGGQSARRPRTAPGMASHAARIERRSSPCAREMRSQQPIEGHAALHDDGEAAAGPQAPRRVGDEIFEQRVVLGEARMQRRIGEDRVPGARGAGEAGARMSLASGTFSRAASKATASLSRRSSAMPGSRASAAAPIDARAAAVVEHAEAGLKRGQGAEQEGRALVDAAGGEHAGVGDPGARNAGDLERRNGAPRRQSRAQRRGVGRAAHGEHAAVAARGQRLDLAGEPRQHAGSRADALVVAAVDDEAAALAKAPRHACAAISCSSLALGSRSSATSNGPGGGQAWAGDAARDETAMPCRNGDTLLRKQRRQASDVIGEQHGPARVDRLEASADQLVGRGLRVSAPSAHRISSGVWPTKRRSKTSRTRNWATSARLIEPAPSPWDRSARAPCPSPGRS